MKNNYSKRLLQALMVVPLLLAMSCGDDDNDGPTINEFLPILNTNFSFTVEGNAVEFTTTLTGNVWVTVNEVNHPFVDRAVTVNLPQMGTYSFTCSSQGSGDVLTSDPFDVVIEEDDLGFLNRGLWLSLSGGANQTKTWRMDMTAEGELTYFDGPMYFSGYENSSERPTEWAYWAFNVLPEDLPHEVDGVEMTSFFNWEPSYSDNEWIMAPGDYGTITFDGTNGTVSTDIFNQTTEGSFSFDTATWILDLTGVVLPIDSSRLNEPQYIDEHLSEVRIFTLTDSAMQIGIRRSFEGFGEDGTQTRSEWINVYNFIVDDYVYPQPEEFTFEEPVNTSVASADLVGTWQLAPVPINWIGWRGIGNQGSTKEVELLNEWLNRDEFANSWFAPTPDQLAAVDAVEHVFNQDGTCTIDGTATTYEISGGKITFGAEVTLVTFPGHWFGSLSGTAFSVLDVPGTADGSFWIGRQNDGNPESVAVHIIKK